jgi:hypothetical protein
MSGLLVFSSSLQYSKAATYRGRCLHLQPQRSRRKTKRSGYDTHSLCVNQIIEEAADNNVVEAMTQLLASFQSQIAEVKERIQPLAQRISEGELSTENGISLLEVKIRILPHFPFFSFRYVTP